MIRIIWIKIITSSPSWKDGEELEVIVVIDDINDVHKNAPAKRYQQPL